MAATAGTDGRGVSSHRSVLLVDDHRIFAQVLQTSLERQPDVAMVDVAHTVREALTRARVEPFDVAVVDLELPDSQDVELVAELKRSCAQMRVVVLTAHARPALVERALSAGADVVLGKESSLEQVLSAMRRAGEAPRVGHREGPPPAPALLTRREQEVLLLLGQGRDPGGVADELNISLYTARDHVKSVMAKLGVRSQLAAVVAAHRAGLISVGSRY